MEIQDALDLAQSAHTKKFMMGDPVSGIEEALMVLAAAYVKLRDAKENRDIHKQKATMEQRTKTLIDELKKIDEALAVAVALGDGKVLLHEDRIHITFDDNVLGGWVMKGVDPKTLPKGTTPAKMVVAKLLEVEDKIRAAVRVAFPDGEVLVQSGGVYVMEPF